MLTKIIIIIRNSSKKFCTKIRKRENVTFKELMYEWIKSKTENPIFSIDEMLVLSDFSDWLDMHNEKLNRKRRTDIFEKITLKDGTVIGINNA